MAWEVFFAPKILDICCAASEMGETIDELSQAGCDKGESSLNKNKSNFDTLEIVFRQMKKG